MARNCFSSFAANEEPNDHLLLQGKEKRGEREREKKVSLSDPQREKQPPPDSWWSKMQPWFLEKQETYFACQSLFSLESAANNKLFSFPPFSGIKPFSIERVVLVIDCRRSDGGKERHSFISLDYVDEFFPLFSYVSSSSLGILFTN